MATKILTVSEPECGAKPIGYAAVIPNGNRDTLKAHIFKGLEAGWGIKANEAEGMLSDEDLDVLKASDYVWFGKNFRFVVEVTILDSI